MMKRFFGAVALVCALGVALAGGAHAQNTTTFGNIVSMGVPCGAANCVYYQLPPATAWVNITVAGTWTGTLEVAATSAPNANYSNLDTVAWTALATESANGTWSASTSGTVYLRVRATSWSGGTANVSMAASQVGSPQFAPLFQGPVTGTSTPGGANAQIQYNNGGQLAGSQATVDAAGNVVAPVSVKSPQLNYSLYASQFGTVAAANIAAALCTNCVMRVDSGSTLALTANTVLNGKWDFSDCGTITRGNFTLGYSQVPTFGSDCQIFDAAGTGIVTFPSGTGLVKGSWFGAVPSNADATNAINQAGASAAASHLPVEYTGNLTVAGQITWNGVNTIRGNGPQGTSITTISTSYTAGCGIQIQNAFDAYVAGITLTYSVSTAGISTASGICTESFRRGNIEHVLVTGANTCFDTSNAGGQANPVGTFQLHIDDFKCYNFTGHGMLLTKAIGSGSSAGDGSMLLSNLRFDNNSAPGGTTPKDFIELGTSSDIHFDTINFQNTVLDGTGPAFSFASDAHNTHLTNLHIEANTFACSSAGSANCSFFDARGTTTLMVDGITFQNNVLNIANILGGKWALFSAATGGNYFRVQHVFSLQNTLTGMVSTPMFNFFESGAAGTGDATLASFDILDASLAVVGYGNFAPSTFKDYLKPSQFPWWFYGAEFSAGDTDQTVDCNRPDHSQTLDYETPFTGNHTLTLVTGTGYNNCQVRVFMNSASTAGTAFTLTVQDDLAHTIGTFTGSRSLQFNFTAHNPNWQLSDAGVLNDLFLSTTTFEGAAVTIKPQVSATAGAPVTSPQLNFQANYPIAGVSNSDFYTLRNVPTGTGDSPPTVLTLTTSGSSGGHSVNFGAANPFAAGLVNSSGTTQTAANITASTGWGTSGAAGNGISAVSGSQRFRFTITAAGTPAANPTIVATFPVTYLTAPICTAQMVGGTGTITPISSGTETTTSTGTMTFVGTPVAASTYKIVVDCRL